MRYHSHVDRRVLSLALLLVAAMVSAAHAAPAGGAPVPPLALPTQADEVACMPRTADARPPESAPKLRGEKEDDPQAPDAGEPVLKPVCPDGEVPVIQPAKPTVPKGNPLLGQEGKPVRAVFDEPPPDPPAACDGVVNPGGCYYYANASYRRRADGGGMTVSVERPVYDGSGGSGHTLAEIAVQGGADDGDIVELGWNVSTSQYADSDPHLFVFHWRGWAPTCYDACGWVQWSSTYYPGMNLSGLVGREVYIGYVVWEGNWWAWFDNQWLGYFPGSEWGGGYTGNQLIQWFGEVASHNGIPPRTDMGNGLPPADRGAAVMATLCDVDAGDWVCWYRDQQLLGATVAAYYDIAHTGFGRVRYGGYGE